MKSRIFCSFILLLCGCPTLAANPLAPERIESHTLPNGLKVILKEDHATPLVALDLWIEAGSADDPPNASGTAHLLEHMLFKGTSKRGVGGIDVAMENLGATLEASTLKDGVHLYATVASRYFPRALDLLAEVATQASLPAEELLREKGVILDEMRLAWADPMRKAADDLTRFAYGDHPYGRSIPGDATTIMAVSRETVEEARKRLLVGSNLTLVMVGDFDPAQALPLVREAFREVPAGAVTRAKLEPVEWRGQGRAEQIVRMKGEFAYVFLGFPGPSVAQPQEVAALDLVVAALGLGEGSRLHKALVGRGLAEQVRVDFLTKRGPGLLTVGVQCRPDRVDRVREVVEEQIAALRDLPLDEMEIRSARRRVLSALAFDLETYAGQASLLGFYEMLGRAELAWRYPEIVASVGASAVRQAARSYLQPGSAIRLTALPPAREMEPSTPGKPKIMPLPDLSVAPHPRPLSLKGREEMKPTFSYGHLDHSFGHTAPLDTVHLLAATENRPSRNLPSPLEGEGPGVRGTSPLRTRLPNGLTVIVKPEPGQPILSARLFVRAGAMHEGSVPAGTAAMLAQLLVTEEAHPSLKEHLGFLNDQVGGGLSVEPGEDSAGFSVLTTRDRLHEALELLGLVATKPRLRLSDVEARRQELRKREASDRDAFRSSMEALLLRLYPDSRLGLPVNGTPATRAAITPEILESFWNERYRLGNMIVVVAGDVDPRALVERIDTVFKKKIMGGASTESRALEPRAAPEAQHSVLERDLPVGAAVVGVRAPGALDDRYPALAVLSAVLGGGKGSRLFRALRDAEGIGYDLGVWSPTRSRHGYLAGFVLADPFRRGIDGSNEPVLETARRAIERELQAVAKGEVTEAELTRARQYVIGSYALRHQRLADRAFLPGWWEAMGAGFAEDEEFPRKVEAVTREAVLKLGAELLRSFTSLTLRPESFPSGAEPVGPPETEGEPGPPEKTPIK